MVKGFYSKFDGHMLEILQSGAVAFFLKLMAALLAFMFNVIVARILGAEGSGIFFWAFMVMMIFTVFARLGLDNTILRLIASNASANNWGIVKGVYKKCVTVVLASSCAASLIMWFSSYWLTHTLFNKPDAYETVKLMALAVLPFALLTIHAEALKGLKCILYSQIVQGVCVPLISIVLLCLFWWVWSVNSTIWVVWVYSIASFITLIVGLLFWRKATLKYKECDPSPFDGFQLKKSCIPLFWVALVALINDSMSTFVLGLYSPSSDIGVFNAALRTAMLISFVLMAVNSIAAPKFSTLYSQNKMKELASISRNSALLMAAFSAPILVIYLTFPSWIMSLFGSEFKEGASALMIMAIGQYVNVITGSVGYLLMMTGNEESMRNTALFSTIVGIIANFLLVPLMGLQGAAIATAVSVMTMNITLVFQVRKKLGFWPLSIFRSV